LDCASGEDVGGVSGVIRAEYRTEFDVSPMNFGLCIVFAVYF